MKAPVHIDADTNSIVDADGRSAVTLTDEGTFRDLEQIVSEINSTYMVSEHSRRVAEEYWKNREVL